MLIPVPQNKSSAIPILDTVINVDLSKSHTPSIKGNPLFSLFVVSTTIPISIIVNKMRQNVITIAYLSPI
jgi:hypothetical protein